MIALVAVALWGLASVFAAMTVLWAASVRLRDASIVDPFWAPGFMLVTATYALAWGTLTPRGVLTLVAVTLWAARLGIHLLRRNRRHGEDPRYAAWRAEHGARFWWVSLFTVFWLQAAILWVVSAPLLVAVTGAAPLGPWDVAGLLVFLTGLNVEAVADLQLERFKADPQNRGRVLDTGLWRYSRHPNYFGNAVLWWGLWLLAVGAGGWWTGFGPILMTFLLVRVSGVRLLEEGLRRSRPGYEDYVRRTSAFVPWPPREGGPG